MIVVRVHADILVLEFALNGFGNLIGQGQGPVAYTAQGGTLITLTPIPAVAGIHRDAVAVGAILKIHYRGIDDQFAQVGISDTQLGGFSLSIKQAEEFGIGVKGSFILPDD